MASVLEGVRVVEVAIYGFVPSAGAVLAEWGADVIKVEHPVTGDPMRGAVYNGIAPGPGRSSVLYEVFNRGKRSIGLDLTNSAGHELLMRLVDDADVFLTNFSPVARRKLGIDFDDIRARNPRIVYGRGSGQGTLGPDAEKGGFDTMSYWCRSGAASGGRFSDASRPAQLPAAGYGDIQSGLFLCAGIAAALVRRERTGEGGLVEVSLLAAGMWGMQASIVGAYVQGAENMAPHDPDRPPNALVNMYRTSDGRYVMLQMLEADRYWPGLCKAIGAEELVNDPRFSTDQRRQENIVACTGEIGRRIAEHDLAYWKAQLCTQDGQWGVVQSAREVLADEQAVANNYVQWLAFDDPATPPLPVVSVPVQFDGTAAPARRAPEHGEATDAVLLSLGLPWEDIIEYKIAGVVV
jgi:crotonobetainyl-CoA:carnitine CoA-transferase CaiB-like acyl-CoA transferase